MSVPAIAAVARLSNGAESTKAPKILLRSSWQVVNIGDIAHTPGVLALIERYIPNAEVTLWASSDLSGEVAEMEHQRFPQLKIVKGTIDANHKASNAELQQAIDETNFLLHGSGPSLVAARDVSAFVAATQKPFGVYGITLSDIFNPPNTYELLSKAVFVYFRDSVSLAVAKSKGVTSPIMEFGPDGAFACDLRADDKADTFLRSTGLETGKFVCCLSRLRYTPYWTIPNKGQKIDETKEARNQAMKEQDHLPIRKAIQRVVEETDLKVLLCPEDMTQMAVGKELLYDPLPDNIKKRVVWRGKFWLTNEALSVYVRSAGLFGSEMHSPIMAIGNGIPAIVCRFEEQTSKGIMWKDIGLGNWLFDFDQASDREKMPEAVVKMLTNPKQSMEMVASAQKRVQELQASSMAVVKQHVESAKG